MRSLYIEFPFDVHCYPHMLQDRRVGVNLLHCQQRIRSKASLSSVPLIPIITPRAASCLFDNQTMYCNLLFAFAMAEHSLVMVSFTSVDQESVAELLISRFVLNVTPLLSFSDQFMQLDIPTLPPFETRHPQPRSWTHPCGYQRVC